jgi:hypothetical protein
VLPALQRYDGEPVIPYCLGCLLGSQLSAVSFQQAAGN